MADKKITDLTELTAPAANDYLEIVDTSTNTNKKISRETLAGWYFLSTPLTSTSWDGDSISTQATGVLIDLSTTHGVPARVKAVMVRCYIRDSASATTNGLYFSLGSGSTGTAQFAVRCSGLPNDYLTDGVGIVPCDANGDIYYRCATSGTGTMDVWIVITGYWR